MAGLFNTLGIWNSAVESFIFVETVGWNCRNTVKYNKTMWEMSPDMAMLEFGSSWYIQVSSQTQYELCNDVTYHGKEF